MADGHFTGARANHPIEGSGPCHCHCDACFKQEWKKPGDQHRQGVNPKAICICSDCDQNCGIHAAVSGA